MGVYRGVYGVYRGTVKHWLYALRCMTSLFDADLYHAITELILGQNSPKSISFGS